MPKFLFLWFLLLGQSSRLLAEDGYELWLRYAPIQDKQLLSEYRKQLNAVVAFGTS